MIIDPIADMLTRIRNANQRKHKNVNIPYSKIKNEITKILLEEGYILDFKIEGTGVKKEIVITLKYKGSSRAITKIVRISKPGLRVYKEYIKIPKVLNGFGISIISTPKGMMTGDKARAIKQGGEVIAFVY